MTSRCAMVAIVGRPNVGKSTLLNHILQQKISITSRKPQTTRHQILGFHTKNDLQLVFVDTPGWQRQPKGQMNRLMNRQVKHALDEVDVAVMLCDARGWQDNDDRVAEILANAEIPRLLMLNKHDLLKSKQKLLPQIETVASQYSYFSEFIPACARTGAGVEQLLNILEELAPQREHLFPSDQVTDRSVRFLCGELIREKTMHYLGDELPYRTTVLIEQFVEETDITRIDATIWVERDSQKSIVIGKGGSLLKRISTDARMDIEALLGKHVYLKVWVRTRRGWSDSNDALRDLGMTE